MVEVHHVLAALHFCVFMVASNHVNSASPVGGTERKTAYSQATRVTNRVFFVVFNKTLTLTTTGLMFVLRTHETGFGF